MPPFKNLRPLFKGPLGLEGYVQHYCVESGDEDIEDQAGDRERHQSLPGGFESNREEADEEHDYADKSQDDGHVSFSNVSDGGCISI